MYSYSAKELDFLHILIDFKTNTYKNIYNIYEYLIEKYTLK